VRQGDQYRPIFDWQKASPLKKVLSKQLFAEFYHLMVNRIVPDNVYVVMASSFLYRKGLRNREADKQLLKRLRIGIAMCAAFFTAILIYLLAVEW
jgi:hypothetical protein